MKRLTEFQKKIRVKRKEKKAILRAFNKKVRDELVFKKQELVKLMFERDKGECVFCHKKVSENHYQTCHIIPQEFPELRYDINNVLLACFYHHKVGKFSMHKHPLWLVNWLVTNRKEQYNYLKGKCLT